MKVFIGFDEREAEAASVAARSLRAVAPDLEPTFLCAAKLRDHGLLTRTSDHRGGQDYDLVSNALKSTRFAISRFLTPILAQEGYALFVDCDVVFHEDPRVMLQEVKAEHAVSVVKHANGGEGNYVKMVDQVQTYYPRKNWSSVMLFNCDHLANRRLSVRDINERPGRDLHAFYWLNDHEIGELWAGWNWLVNVNPDRPQPLCISHFTLGGPWIPGWAGAEHDDIWLKAAGR